MKMWLLAALAALAALASHAAAHGRGWDAVRLRGGSRDEADTARQAQRTVRVAPREAAAVEFLRACMDPEAEREGDNALSAVCASSR